ncbi:chloramphenicol resistance protein [Streptomyces chrestomyceticus JCM 4735]|uniref:Chloramphenicol resistance protein n=1 Tax=Streptomyces chrestomyceticus JCM 4735 TaxID=1306181 RepID=A0A7U9KUT3_9ACTN|nr:Cmx/CmrA family chloramphenicol efflux MFS transporter [Streptomyces chrestomyceticus]GCD35188.1 chloramphenicol resistance protein [Streptomyces chrestomyceticus JCM 4735]
MPIAVYLLGLGIFAQGTSEFMLAGLLPNVAADLGVSIPDAGLLVSAFAIGMVVGAPVLAIGTLRLPRRTALIAFQLVFVAGHVVGALAPGYGVLFATRVVSAFAYAGFWAVAAAAAVSLVPAGAKGKALSVVGTGLTLATIVGVPVGTVLSQHAGWRAAFWGVVALTAASLASLLAALPAARPAAGELPSVRCEIAAMSRPALWVSYLLTTLSFGAAIVTFSYLTPLLTEVSGLPASLVPAVLALYGVGGLLGMTLGGRTADRHPLRTLFLGIGGLTTASALLALTAENLPVTIALVFTLGLTGYVTNPVVQSRVFTLAPNAPTLAPAVNTSAFNVGITLTPMLGGLTIDAGFGYTSVAWVGAAVGATALGAALWVAALQRRTEARAVMGRASGAVDAASTRPNAMAATD